MITINCGTRRIVSDRYGYQIQHIKTYSEDNKKAGETYWKEDAPAYPATLSQALEMILEREIKDHEEIACTQLSAALDVSIGKIREYFNEASMLGKRLEK